MQRSARSVQGGFVFGRGPSSRAGVCGGEILSGEILSGEILNGEKTG